MQEGKGGVSRLLGVGCQALRGRLCGLPTPGKGEAWGAEWLRVGRMTILFSNSALVFMNEAALMN